MRLELVRARLRDLATVLEVLYVIHCRKDGLYDDNFLAFVGDKVIRGWPGKDFPFYSEEAAAIAEAAGFHLEAGITRLPKPLAGLLHPEHWTPISFFRDVFDMGREGKVSLTADDFYELLVHYYRVVWISQPEMKKLDRKNRTARTAETYDRLGIIVRHGLWPDVVEDPAGEQDSTPSG